MDNKVSYTLVGLFVVVLSIALIATILWLSAGTEQKVYDTYQVYLKESVSGLNRKAPVKYRGVEVGYVRSIALEPDRPNEVALLLDIERGTPLKRNTLATLASQGLTGLAYIELTGGTANVLPELKVGQPYPELQTKPSLLVRLDTAITTLLTNLDNVSGIANSLLTNLNKLSHTANAFFSQDNLAAISHTLHNIDVFTSTLAARSATIDTGMLKTVELLDNLNKISAKLPVLLAQMDKSLVAIEQTANTASKTANMVNTLIETSRKDFKQTTQALSEAAIGVNTTLNSSRQDIEYFTRQTLPEIANSVRELHELLSVWRTLSQDIQRKPNILLLGKPKTMPGPGE